MAQWLHTVACWSGGAGVGLALASWIGVRPVNGLWCASTCCFFSVAVGIASTVLQWEERRRKDIEDIG